MGILISMIGYIAYCGGLIDWWQCLIVNINAIVAIFIIDRIFWKKMR